MAQLGFEILDLKVSLPYGESSMTVRPNGTLFFTLPLPPEIKEVEENKFEIENAEGVKYILRNMFALLTLKEGEF